MKATKHVRAPNLGGQYASRTMNGFAISPCGSGDCSGVARNRTNKHSLCATADIEFHEISHSLSRHVRHCGATHMASYGRGGNTEA